MTIEEKAPYLDRANEYWYQNTNIIGLYSKESELEVKNAYIDGLAEGKKEGILSMLDKCEEFRHKANELEDENAELEKENGKLQGKIADLETEYYELENFKDNENAELKAQIEKMKNCENCQTVTDVNGVCYMSQECKNKNLWRIKNGS